MKIISEKDSSQKYYYDDKSNRLIENNEKCKSGANSLKTVNFH